MSNPFAAFADLPIDLQREALREGEQRLVAQLQVATAADQRALTWGGLLVAAATGALGGGLALMSGKQPNYLLGLLAIVFAAGTIAAAWKAVGTVQPSLYCLPGNKPANWLPSAWDCTGTERKKTATARAEQAEQLSSQIDDNAAAAADRARLMKQSFQWAFRTIVCAGACLFLILGGRVALAVWPQINFRALWVLAG